MEPDGLQTFIDVERVVSSTDDEHEITKRRPWGFGSPVRIFDCLTRRRARAPSSPVLGVPVIILVVALGASVQVPAQAVPQDSAAGAQVHVALAFDGTNYLAVWHVILGLLLAAVVGGYLIAPPRSE